MPHCGTYPYMKPKRPFKILALILAFSMMGGMVPQAFGDCGSPCCDSRGCHPNLEPTNPDRCHLADILITEIKSASCNMKKFPSVEGTRGAYLTVSRAQEPAPGMHAVLSYELTPLSNLMEGRVRRPLILSRAAPEPLYLQNLTLLI